MLSVIETYCVFTYVPGATENTGAIDGGAMVYVAVATGLGL